MAIIPDVFNYFCTIFSNIWAKFLLALTREQLQASLNWQSCVSNASGSEIWDLWFQFCFFRPQFSGKWRVWGKLLDNWQLLEDALYLSHILLAVWYNLTASTRLMSVKRGFLYATQARKLSLVQVHKKKPARTVLSPPTSVGDDAGSPFNFFHRITEKLRTISLYRWLL